MELWKIDVFENSSDIDPIRTGFFYASSEDDACRMATEAMGTAWRADFCTSVTGPTQIPAGFVAWVAGVL